MNKRFLLALGLAAFCGLLAILVAQQYLQKELDDRRLLSDSPVVAAKVDIPAGTKIKPEQIKFIPYRRSEIPVGAFTSLSEVVGCVALTDLPAQTPVLTRQVAKPNEASNIITDRLRDGMRAVAVRVDEASSVAGFATPGNFVDVIAVMNPGGSSRPISKVILQNIRILASGKQTQARADGKEVASNTVTLEVTPGQGETLKLAEREGTLQLMLRSTADSAYAQTPGAGTNDVIDSSLIRRAMSGLPRTSSPEVARAVPYFPSLAMALPASTNDAANAKAKKSPASEAAPSPSPKAYTIEIIEGVKPRTVQVTP